MLKYVMGRNPSTVRSGYEFKMQHSFDKRKEESKRIIEKYSDKIPVILEKGESTLLPNIKKQKFLLQRDLTVGQYLYIIRQQLKLDSSESMFLIVNESYIPPNSASIEEIYTNHADKDGFLYITYSAQQVFG